MLGLGVEPEFRDIVPGLPVDSLEDSKQRELRPSFTEPSSADLLETTMTEETLSSLKRGTASEGLNRQGGSKAGQIQPGLQDAPLRFFQEFKGGGVVEKERQAGLQARTNNRLEQLNGSSDRQATNTGTRSLKGTE